MAHFPTKILSCALLAIVLSTGVGRIAVHADASDAARPDAAAAAVLTGVPWIDMDYGPFLAATVEAVFPPGNIANKGMVINLGGRTVANVLFDVDLLRYAAGWVGGDLNWSNVVFDGQHERHPRAVGQQIFGNPAAPGWSLDGDFCDPRKLPYGPLPPERGRYRGVYLCGRQVVLSYEISATGILDSPNYAHCGAWHVFTRTIRIGPTAATLVLQVAAVEGASVSTRSWSDEPTLGRAVAESFVETGAEGQSRLIAVCLGDVEGVTWELGAPGQVRLAIQGSDKPRLLAIRIAWQAGNSDSRALPDDLRQYTPRDPQAGTEGGQGRWKDVLVTRGRPDRSAEGPFAVDQITWPAENPWRSWLRFGGFDFFSDPRKAAICTWSGDVWTVSGLDDDLEELRWRRIASGLFQPLGLRIVDNRVYVCCRDQIVVLHDLNNDSEADFYQCFNTDHQVTPHFHEFAMDLQTDPAGNFYYAKSARHALDSVVPQHGTLICVSSDGRQSEIVCNGFRAANGVGLGPRGEIATSDQEGHWIPASRINLVHPGGFYGNMFSYHQGARPTHYIPPMVWLPKLLDRSPAEQLWVPDGHWGPLEGKMLSLSYGTGEIFLVLRDPHSDVPQGAIVRVPGLSFPTGIMRGRFSPGDGHLYVCGLFGWSSNRTQPGGFYRVRRTGAPLRLPVEFRVLSDGVAMTFSDPLDDDSAADPDNYLVERWNYRWTANYGSEHYRVSDPAEVGQDEVRVEAARLSADGRTVTLTWQDHRPVMQLKISYAIAAADGAPLRQEIFATINAVPRR